MSVYHLPDLPPGAITVRRIGPDGTLTVTGDPLDPMMSAGDYFFQALDDEMVRRGFWSRGERTFKREARRVRMARKRRRGYA